MNSWLKKTILRSAFLAGALLALSAAAQSNKIALVNLQKLFDGYYKTTAANATLKDSMADFDKELNALVSQYQKATNDFAKALNDANNQAVSADEREKNKKAAETKFRESQELGQAIAQFKIQANSTMEEKQRRFTENILTDIRAVINARAKTAGYSLVLDTSGESLSKAPVVIYTNGENDITDVILAQLNANAPRDTLKPPEKKKEK